MTSVKLTWLKLRGSSDQNIFVLWSNKIFVSVIRYSNETKLPLYTNINTEDNLQIIHAPIQLANWRAQTINPKKIWTDWKYFPFQNKLCIDIWKIFTAIWARKACCCWFVFLYVIHWQVRVGSYLWDLWLMLVVYYTERCCCCLIWIL